jgi:hypothetical protein
VLGGVVEPTAADQKQFWAVVACEGASVSSGWNGIPIRGLGKTRRKLAELLCRETGLLVEPHDLKRTNPNHRHYEDCCAWDCYAIRPRKGSVPEHKVHIYSWDTMTACVRGIDITKDDYTSTGGISLFDLEVVAKEDPA